MHVYSILHSKPVFHSEHSLRHQILEVWEDSMEVNYTYESFQKCATSS